MKGHNSWPHLGIYSLAGEQELYRETISTQTISGSEGSRRGKAPLGRELWELNTPTTVLPERFKQESIKTVKQPQAVRQNLYISQQ
ncbi:hypothetical protein E2C01_093745 [Portunus trituberculatus]|uniref:Uncharacterized protein n=1 Tax=Portunus trituberculatus TaxID=210409 RepID=A0A5B7JYZ2_PORTR|nr:hypothetical protein [Portunus trituberculatus]